MIQNEADTPIGLVGDWLFECGVSTLTVKAFENELIPNNWESRFAGLIVLGGSMGAYQEADFPVLVLEKELLRAAAKSQMPIMGICLGAQLLASALGAKVSPGAVPEIGIYDLNFLESAKEDPLFFDLPGAQVKAAQWHQDYISEPPSNLVVLADSAVCPIQAFKVSEYIYGVQFHPEVDQHIFASWNIPGDVAATRLNIDINRAIADVADALPDLVDTWRPIFHRWARLL